MKPCDFAITSFITSKPYNLKQHLSPYNLTPYHLITLNSVNSRQFPPTRFHAFVSLHCQQNKEQMNRKEKLSIAESAPLKAAKCAISQRKPTHFTA